MALSRYIMGIAQNGGGVAGMEYRNSSTHRHTKRPQYVPALKSGRDWLKRMPIGDTMLSEILLILLRTYYIITYRLPCKHMVRAEASS
jgi:hypothetical protein